MYEYPGTNTTVDVPVSESLSRAWWLLGLRTTSASRHSLPLRLIAVNHLQRHVILHGISLCYVPVFWLPHIVMKIPHLPPDWPGSRTA